MNSIKILKMVHIEKIFKGKNKQKHELSVFHSVISSCSAMLNLVSFN